MRNSPIALALMLFSSDSPRQRVVAEPVNASRNFARVCRLPSPFPDRNPHNGRNATRSDSGAGGGEIPVLLLQLQNLGRFLRTGADHAAAANRLR